MNQAKTRAGEIIKVHDILAFELLGDILIGIVTKFTRERGDKIIIHTILFHNAHKDWDTQTCWSFDDPGNRLSKNFRRIA